jgi:hypothetical protein
MAKKNIKKTKGKTRKKSSKRKFFYIQAALTLLIAGYLIISGMTQEKSVTGNVISSSGAGTSNPSFAIFLILGVGLGLFAVIEIIILLITAYF